MYKINVVVENLKKNIRIPGIIIMTSIIKSSKNLKISPRTYRLLKSKIDIGYLNRSSIETIGIYRLFEKHDNEVYKIRAKST